MSGTQRGLIILLLVFVSANSDLANENEDYLKFPENFLLGAASSAYQIEGAWNVSDKGESVWDRYCHQEAHSLNNENGDIACDSYHKYREDVALLKRIGMQAYRFSLSWSRILPNGFANKISEDGITYYKNLVDELLANGIEPIVTLTHFDHPQIIEDAGGWLNPRIVDWFGDYARIVFRKLGPKVKKFITINEPMANCRRGYAGVHFAPDKNIPGVAEYLCTDNSLKAHATVYRIYEKEFKPTQNGSVGVNLFLMHYYPKYDNDTESVERAFQFYVGWFLHPIYSKTGDYPAVMKERIAEKSLEENFPRSRLPELSPKWIECIRGSSDFLTINHYTSLLVEKDTSQQKGPSFQNDLGVITSYNPSWKNSSSWWLKVVPEGFREALRKVATEYGHPPMYVVENGVSGGNEINDVERVNYYESYVKQMLFAINVDRVNLKGYILWSILDNFEWLATYRERFGLIHVDFSDPQRKRTLKKSAYWWKEVTHSRRWQPATVVDGIWNSTQVDLAQE